MIYTEKMLLHPLGYLEALMQQMEQWNGGPADIVIWLPPADERIRAVKQNLIPAAMAKLKDRVKCRRERWVARILDRAVEMTLPVDMVLEEVGPCAFWPDAYVAAHAALMIVDRLGIAPKTIALPMAKKWLHQLFATWNVVRPAPNARHYDPDNPGTCQQWSLSPQAADRKINDIDQYFRHIEPLLQYVLQRKVIMAEVLPAFDAMYTHEVGDLRLMIEACESADAGASGSARFVLKNDRGRASLALARITKTSRP